MSQKDVLVSIPPEMREASRGSFPISPATMEGHYIVADLYWFYRQHELRNKTVVEVFGKDAPEPPVIVVPPGHNHLSAPEGVNNTVWKKFLDISFTTRPDVDYVAKIQELIRINANSDKQNFAGRLGGQKSRIATGGMAPSLLKAFAFENRFPFLEHEFNRWLVAALAWEIRKAARDDFKEAWTSGLKALVLMWNAQFPEDPFVPGMKV